MDKAMVDAKYTVPHTKDMAKGSSSTVALQPGDWQPSLTCARKVVCHLSAIVALQREHLCMLSNIIGLKHDLQLHLLLPIEGKSSRAELEWPQLH